MPNIRDLKKDPLRAARIDAKEKLKIIWFAQAHNWEPAVALIKKDCETEPAKMAWRLSQIIIRLCEYGDFYEANELSRQFSK